MGLPPRTSWPMKLIILVSSKFDCEILPPMNKAREGLRMTAGINLSLHMHVTHVHMQSHIHKNMLIHIAHIYMKKNG